MSSAGDHGRGVARRALGAHPQRFQLCLLQRVLGGSRYFGMVASWCRGPRQSWPVTR